MTTKNLAKVYSAELEGIDARVIEVEIDLNIGLHFFTIVGLADKALNEARERVNSALKNSGMKPPNRENRRITINLAPADVRKTGAQYDLAIAIGYLLATRQIEKFDTSKIAFVGELALDGKLRTIRGALNIAEAAARRGFTFLFLPRANADEGSAIKDVAMVPLDTLHDALSALKDPTQKIYNADKNETECLPPGADILEDGFDDIIGHENAKRALVIAAAGGHNVLLSGPPGVGKSMLAQSARGILPALSHHEAIEATKIWSAAGLSPGRLMRERPFRAPHHTASATAIMGGGQDPRPGEISLAHHGVLFLDELPEFPRNVLEALREPMERGLAYIARSKRGAIFPADFMLVAAMNPCPCGFYGDLQKPCKCAAYEVVKYQKKISGPLLDRIDLQVSVERVEIEMLRAPHKKDEGGGVGNIRTAITRAREMQHKRFGSSGTPSNARMGTREVRSFVALEPSAEGFLATFDRKHLSPRGYYRVLKVARTIADLEGSDRVAMEHIAEAYAYRIRDQDK